MVGPLAEADGRATSRLCGYGQAGWPAPLARTGALSESHEVRAFPAPVSCLTRANPCVDQHAAAPNRAQSQTSTGAMAAAREVPLGEERMPPRRPGRRQPCQHCRLRRRGNEPHQPTRLSRPKIRSTPPPLVHPRSAAYASPPTNGVCPHSTTPRGRPRPHGVTQRPRAALSRRGDKPARHCFFRRGRKRDQWQVVRDVSSGPQPHLRFAFTAVLA